MLPKIRTRPSYWGLIDRRSLEPHLPPTDEKEHLYYVYVRRFPAEVEYIDIHQEFIKYGPIGHIVTRRATSEAFVGFKSASGAHAAVKDPKYALRLAQLRVTLAHTAYVSHFL